MLKEITLGILRHLLSAGGTLAVTEGLATGDQITAIAGGAAAVYAVIWSAYRKYKRAV